MSNKIRGIRGPIPPGYVLGRTGTGQGDVGLVKISDFSSKAYVQQVVPVGADPSATAGDAAVAGTATTYMRSDAAPPVQKGTAAAFGIVKADGTTITSAAGVISAVIPSSNGVLPLVNGDLPGPSAIADDKGQFIGVPL